MLHSALAHTLCYHNTPQRQSRLYYSTADSSYAHAYRRLQDDQSSPPFEAHSTGVFRASGLAGSLRAWPEHMTPYAVTLIVHQQTSPTTFITTTTTTPSLCIPSTFVHPTSPIHFVLHTSATPSLSALSGFRLLSCFAVNTLLCDIASPFAIHELANCFP